MQEPEQLPIGDSGEGVNSVQNSIIPKKNEKPIEKRENPIKLYLKEHKELTIGLIAGGIIGGLIVLFAVFVCIAIGSLLVGYFLRLGLEKREQGENNDAKIGND